MATYRFTVDGKRVSVDAQAEMPLLYALRDDLKLDNPHFGCGLAQCGACTVHVAGRAMRSCVLPAAAVGPRPVTTIEAVGNTPGGKRLQNAWLGLEVVQCGYCQPGQIMSATALLNSKAKPTDADIDAAMSGNICRCATYTRIRAAIKRASGQKEA